MAKRRHSYNSGRVNRADKNKGYGSEYTGNGYEDWDDQYLPPPEPIKRKRRWPKVVLALVLVMAIAAGGFGIVSHYMGGVFNTDLLGTILPIDDLPSEYDKSEVVHVLVIGIDNEEGRNYGAGLGLTDMLLYVRYDLVNNSVSMLQIPRDSYVGESYNTGGSGKINALLISGEDQENPINNLTTAFQQQFKLPVDHYVALDMSAMTAIVDTFGGLYVYVPQEMSYDGSYLPQGWQWLTGEQAEFFVRNRHGTGFERGDIDRLDNQRHFYSALFRRLLDMTPMDILNLLPVFDHYCSTDMDFNSDMVALAVSALSLSSENVMFCKVPGATGPELDPTGAERSLYIIDLYGRGTEQDPGLAHLLNTYFRDPQSPVPAEELLLPQIRIPSGYALYPPNVQMMQEVQEPEGGSDVNVDWHEG